MAKYKVPDDGLEATNSACVKEIQRLRPGTLIGYATVDAMCIVDVVLEAFIRWQSENPVVPNDEQLFGVSGSLDVGMAQIVWSNRDRALIAEWLRRMYLAPLEPEVPEAVKDLLLVDAVTFQLPDGSKFPGAASDRNAAVIEAFRRGRESTK